MGNEKRRNLSGADRMNVATSGQRGRGPLNRPAH
jgi:hypothetical protein